MAFKKSFSKRSYKKKTSFKKTWPKSASSFKPVKSCLSDSAPYPRTLLDWLLKDDKLLADGIEANCDLADLASMLDREPVSVLNRLNRDDLFLFETGSEEQIELYSLALSGVPLIEVLRWCVASDARLHWSEIEALRKIPDPKPGIELALQSGMWRLTADDLDDLYWIGEQSPTAVSDAVNRILGRFDAPTPQTVRTLLSGSASMAHADQEVFWSAISLRDAAVVEMSKRKISATQNPKSRSTGRGRGRFRKYSKSPSYSPGLPAPDTRTAAERAWETRSYI